MASVIVFGPTGQIGSVVARTAGHLGAKVWLAMRDTSKAIPGLTKEAEEKDGMQRVQADLSNTDTIIQAVKTSGAKRAFVYLLHPSSDNMKAVFESLKSGGIEFPVFLSSFTIHTDKKLRDIPASEAIPYVHAQAETNLHEVFGEGQYVAVRPGAFATNLLQYSKAIAAGELSLYGGTFKQDNVVSADTGRVAASILVSGPKNGQNQVYVYGPEIRSVEDSVKKIGEVFGNDIKVTAKPREEAYDEYIKAGLPEFFAKYMTDVLSNEGRDKGGGELFPHYEEGVNNVQLYTGQPSTTLEQWALEHRTNFSS